MTLQIGLMLAILAGTMVLLAFEIVTEDVVALGVLIVLIISGLLTPDEAFSGFGSDTFILLLGLFVMTAGLTRTGVVEIVGRVVQQRPDRVLLIILVGTAGLSAFLSNTAAAAFFLPLVLGVARRLDISPSKLLLPMAFASIVTSGVTLISTSTNIVVSGLISRYGLEPMGMFELAPVGIVISVAGVAYIYFFAPRLIPDRIDNADRMESLNNAVYASEVVITDDSPLAGKTLAEARFASEYDLSVLRIVRNKSRYIVPKANARMQAGDIMLVQGDREALLRVKDISGLELKADLKFGELVENVEANDDNAQEAEAEFEGDTMALVERAERERAERPERQASPEMNIAELLIVPNSQLINRTLRGSRFRERYGVHVLAINRHGETLRRKLSQVPLRLGDVLLVQGTADDFAQLQPVTDSFQFLGAVETPRVNRRRAPTAVAIFVAAILAATFNMVPFSVAGLIGMIAMFLTRCITPEEAYRAVEWKALILIGSMLALGVAMDKTGTAQYAANLITNWVGNSSSFLLLSGFFILTVLLTQPMSNQAASVVVIPIALATATQLGLNPRSFAMTIALAASCSYLTPLEPASLMVYGPGGYRFVDFFRVGAPLTIVIYIITMIGVPIVWPLNS
jgi:di/tricarboxylate transporter